MKNLSELKKPTPEVTQDFLEACERGDLDLIQKIFQEYCLDNQNIINVGFTEACSYGNIDVVKYLLTSTEIPIHADIHFKEDSGLHEACSNGYTDIVKYLLTSPELKEHANINSKDDYALTWACIQGHLDTAKYLISSPELNKHSQILSDRDFMHAVKNNHLDIVNYFIFDINFKETDQIITYLAENPNEKISNWFKIRQINEDLNNNLPVNRSDKNNNPRAKL